MPVSKISTFGVRSANAGGSRWIDQRSASAGGASFSSTGSPRTFHTRPSVTSPTGTEIGPPVSTTSCRRGGCRRSRPSRRRGHVVAEMLLHLRDQIRTVRAADAQGRVDLREMAVGKDSVDDDALDLEQLAVCSCVRRHVSRAPGRVKVGVRGPPPGATEARQPPGQAQTTRSRVTRLVPTERSARFNPADTRSAWSRPQTNEVTGFGSTSTRPVGAGERYVQSEGADRAHPAGAVVRIGQVERAGRLRAGTPGAAPTDEAPPGGWSARGASPARSCRTRRSSNGVGTRCREARS